MHKENKENRPVVVASFLNPNEAHLFRGLLESEGIESYIYHERATTFMPITVSGVQVAVQEKDLERARFLLKQVGNIQNGTTLDDNHKGIQ